MRRSTFLFAFLMVAAFGSASAATDGTIRKGFNVGDGGTLTLDADLGDVKVVSGGTGVAVEILRTADNAETLRRNDVTFDQQGNDVAVRSRYERMHTWFNSGRELRIRYNIRVPSHYNVKLSTSGGDIDLGNLAGQANVHTSGGNIHIANINGTVDAHTSGGDVHLDSSNGPALIRTSGGDIEIGRANGRVEAKTSGGSIEITYAASTVTAHTSGGSIRIKDALDAVDASTSGGSIHARISRQPSAETRLTTSGGNLTLEVPASLGAMLDAHASGGGIDADIPVTIQGRRDEDSLVGTVGGGGPRLVLRTSGGGITIRRS
jgi:DUF4097 and DUF4098 domain-containing protein YvlB